MYRCLFGNTMPIGKIQTQEAKSEPGYFQSVIAQFSFLDFRSFLIMQISEAQVAVLLYGLLHCLPFLQLVALQSYYKEQAGLYRILRSDLASEKCAGYNR